MRRLLKSFKTEINPTQEQKVKINKTKNPTKEQKKVWIEKAKEKQKFAREQVETIAKEFRTNPEVITEYLQFGSKFYQYSPKNTMLIYAQNPGATYVQSFKAWKDEGFPVKKGEHGLAVYVPVKTTLLKINENEYVQLRYATKEQKEAMRSGKIESITKLNFEIGNVFDISQTNFPPERYPEFFDVGYPSEKHHAISKALTEYAQEHLKYDVNTSDLKSISLRGTHNGTTKKIHVNQLLNDTMYLSTLSHEIGHAIAGHSPGSQKSVAQKEYEGDCFSILLYSKLGLEINDARKRHFAGNFREYEEELKARYQDLDPEEMEKSINQEMESSFSHVFSKFGQEIENMQPYIDKHTKGQQHSAEQPGKSNVEKYKKKYARQMENYESDFSIDR